MWWFFWNWLFTPQDNPSPGPKPSNPVVDLLAKLNALSEGLLFPSESDFPLISFFWLIKEAQGPLSEAQIRVQTGVDSAPVELREVDEFFQRVTEVQEYFEEQQRKDAIRYQALVVGLKESLTNIRVYRVGEIQIRIYVVGEVPSIPGGYAGVATTLIET